MGMEPKQTPPLQETKTRTPALPERPEKAESEPLTSEEAQRNLDYLITELKRAANMPETETYSLEEN